MNSEKEGESFARVCFPHGDRVWYGFHWNMIDGIGFLLLDRLASSSFQRIVTGFEMDWSGDPCLLIEMIQSRIKSYK